MDEQAIDISGEVARVHRELVLFRDELLPAIIDWDTTNNLRDEHARPLRDWRAVADRLLDALPGLATGELRSSPVRGDFEEFLFQPAESSHLVRNGRVAWRIELFIGWEWAAEDVLSLIPNRSRHALVVLHDLRLNLPEVRRRIMALPVDESYLWNLLCISLVPIADLDPAFAKLALEGETWRTIVLGDREIDEETRGRRLKAVDGYFRHVLNNALLHVMGALACNHFEVIPDLLDHPDLIGSYTSLMPHYLFAVLFEKAKCLHDMVKIG